MRNYLFLFLLLAALAACSTQAAELDVATGGNLRPSQVTSVNPTSEGLAAPQGDFFYSLPNYGIGETVTLDGYTARLEGVDLQDGRLNIDLTLGNESGRPIDLVWAVQLIREEQGYLAPEDSPVIGSAVGESFLSDSDELGGVWTYDLIPDKRTPDDLTQQAEIDLDNYRLLFVPFGWSGPVFVFRLIPPTQ